MHKSNLITKDELHGELEILNNYYPNGRKTATELKTMSYAWYKDFCYMTHGMFCRSLEMARKTSEFWPTPALILRCYNGIVAQPQSIKPASGLVEPSPDEDEEIKDRKSVV